ncbi:hypothetical protein A1O1_04078 [Capronia coronata CBS 617.96]|uniref:Transcriptional coactivator HFI1/ADA1 n=1 Tax=Capronia coronata CBS 617.96 TaxID=1182541 RepID=W9YP18_9EURO|nr:uncharacterized protein A1O1_04078 [Capronia coronata CBS 617.96]EXJ90971.1 hypothetical protein A1O1_04078 [Capronia coronata CBS 617.96]
MATLDDTFNPAALTRSDTITSVNSTTKVPPGSSSKPTKPTQNYPRIDLEPLYTELKSLIGHHWETYYDAITRFIRGELNAREFGDLCDAFIYASPQSEHAHNSLVLAILCNTSRDPPDPGLAAWVSATTDKSAVAASSKPAITSDAAEQRLKVEVMALPPRDRRRLKAIANDKAEEEAMARKTPYEDYYNALRIKAPEQVSGSAGGLTKTNWDLEIRKRYLQPLFSETLEFPDTPTLHARIVPICYEESVSSGCSVQCAELVGIAAESYLKGILGEVFDRTRSNGPRYDNSASGGILTSSYQKKIAREATEVKMGRLRRTLADDLLPTESEVAYSRRPMGMPDLQLTAQVGPLPWNAMPLLGATVTNASAGYDYEDWRASQEYANASSDGLGEPASDPMDVDNNDNYGWEGAGAQDRAGLESVLADCLTIRV